MDRVRSLVIGHLQKYYSLSEVKPNLIRSYTNDVYEVVSKPRHLLKIFGENWRTEEELLFEIDLLNFLKNEGIRVSAAVMGKDGIKLHRIDVDGQERYAILYEWAEGRKPNPPFSGEDRELLGEAIAKIHEATVGFKSNHTRPSLDLDYLITQPLISIQKAVQNHEMSVFFENFAAWLRSKIDNFMADGLDFGVVHADVTFDNVHFTKKGGVVFYDFDSGGFGYRAIDLQGWAVFELENVHKQQEFLKGYRSIRNIGENDILASPYFFLANEFWGIALDLDRRILKHGELATNKYIEGKTDEFRGYQKYFEKHQCI